MMIVGLSHVASHVTRLLSCLSDAEHMLKVQCFIVQVVLQAFTTIIHCIAFVEVIFEAPCTLRLSWAPHQDGKSKNSNSS